jgi:hypothetical protein
LVDLAANQSAIFSVGCDLGAHEEASLENERHIAGGYVQLMYASYANKDPDEYQVLGDALAQAMEERAGEHSWRVVFVLSFVAFNSTTFQNSPHLCVSGSTRLLRRPKTR